MAKHYYGRGLPGVSPAELKGLLIVVEGPDGSGRSMQSALLRDWLGRLGYPTTEVGLKRSGLVGAELNQAMGGNTLHPLTLSLFYATDFADQLENSIVPSLRAGFIVVADRYIYTLMARDIVRGVDSDWVKDMYGLALVPDVRIYLDVPPKTLAERSFRKRGVLDYWESGMDIQRSGDLYQCFIRYQNDIRREFRSIIKQYEFAVIDGNRDALAVHRDIQVHMKPFLDRRSSKRRPAAGDPAL